MSTPEKKTPLTVEQATANLKEAKREEVAAQRHDDHQRRKEEAKEAADKLAEGVAEEAAVQAHKHEIIAPEYKEGGNAEHPANWPSLQA